MNLKRRIEGLEERLEPRDEPFEDGCYRTGASRPLDANLTRVTVLSASISVNRGNRPRAKRTLRLHCWTASFLVHAAYSFRI